jgi:NTP pyrophosphatase (non-canonical NTP hydrolase)
MPKDHEWSTKIHDAIEDVEAEVIAQEAMKAEGRFEFTPSDLGMSEEQGLLCIIEEVGEVARNLLARQGLTTDGDKSDKALRKELSQIAALSVQMMARVPTVK